MAFFSIPKPHTQAKPGARPFAGRVLTLTKGLNPTYSYYLEERFRRSKAEHIRRDLTERLDDIDPAGLFVVVCRYIRWRQLRWILKHQHQLAGVALFLDDDLAAILTGSGSTLEYKFHITYNGILPLPMLNKVLTHLWVSTPALADALSGNGNRITVVEPFPPPEAWRAAHGPTDYAPRLTLAFHATSGHNSEHLFLLPVIEAVLKRHQDIVVEIYATGRLAAMWRRLGEPQIRVMPYLKWPAYFEKTRVTPVDILLVPLVHNAANQVRSDTKRIDACRLNAAAVFTKGPAYIHHADPDEILVENTESAWIDAISRLIEDPDLRARTRDATRRVLETVTAQEPAPLFPPLCSRP